ncbi:ABC transporter permease [Extibacter muris]|uniref:ABC transporter permease n=1 Tax=Extibacter muris TaxID=1796622 RepID=UPI001D06E5AE|nr:ABC transporter permease [Extibacter muris]MCB6203529.1 ABC transporter permease [Extibacter muris]MCQ4665720.1 ABC transporter permease [Extibacter muris]MCQ4695213.1 ABC transporter permease [Extibacter muris]
MRNNNRKVVIKLSNRNFKSSRMRNIFAVGAIALTCILFTVLASTGVGMMQVSQEQIMREVGGKFHASLEGALKEEMEKITADPRVKASSWNIYVGQAENILKRNGELRYTSIQKELENSFIALEEGRMPKDEDDMIVDTFILDELKLPHKLGVKVPLTFYFQGEKIEKTFTVCGWYEGDGVSHASQLYISEEYWKKLKGDRTGDDFKEWARKHPEDSSVGCYAVGLFFDNTKNIESTVQSVIEDAGYEPGKQVEYSVNWAYIQNRAEKVGPGTLFMMAGALAVIILTGYLIIFNIFQISILQDIRFYALLKTIGTTKKQIKYLIRRQAFLLSLAGIPIGLAAGYGISKVMFPAALSMLDLKDMKITLHFHPAIVLFAAGFSLLTVAVSCRRPGKIAGSVSPVEAVRYTEGNKKRKKAKKTENGARIHAMALSNLGRNKKKTVFVILSMSLSVILLCMVLTAMGSFQLDTYLKSRLTGDVTAANINYTSSSRSSDFTVDADYVEMLDSQPGILSRSEMWSNGGLDCIYLGEKEQKKYQELDGKGLLRKGNAIDTAVLKERLDAGLMPGNRYAYDEALLMNLKVLKGELDMEKFKQGGFVLATTFLGEQTENLYEPGDKVTLGFISGESVQREIKNKEGEVTDVLYENQRKQEYEVMAVIEIPSSMNKRLYNVNGVDFVLPLENMKENTLNPTCFAVSYELEKDVVNNFEAAAKDYTENVNPYMGYLSKKQLKEEFSGLLGGISALGIAMSGVIAFIGILNFINSTITGIFSRKQEFAVLCSIGMTKNQLKKMLLEEGLYYVLIASGISIVFGSILSWAVLRALNQVILFFDYRYNPWAFVIMIPIFAAIACVVPVVGITRVGRESIVERLRESQS